MTFPFSSLRPFLFRLLMVVGSPVNECIATAIDSSSSGPESSEIHREIMFSPPKIFGNQYRQKTGIS